MPSTSMEPASASGQVIRSATALPARTVRAAAAAAARACLIGNIPHIDNGRRPRIHEIATDPAGVRRLTTLDPCRTATHATGMAVTVARSLVVALLVAGWGLTLDHPDAAWGAPAAPRLCCWKRVAVPAPPVPALPDAVIQGEPLAPARFESAIAFAE